MKATAVPDEQHGGVCSRPRLLDAIDEGLVARRLVLIQAIAGAGKSVLLDQWVVHRRLQHPDEDIVRIDQADAEALVQGLVTDRPVVVVVDDADHLSPSVLEHLDRLLADGATGVRVVLAGRTRPALSLARLGLDGQVAYLRTADLALHINELTDLIAHLVGARPPPEVGLRLLHETEGWMAGVKLLASPSLVALDTATDADTDADTDTDTEPDVELGNFENLRAVADYVAEQALDPLSDDLRQFLLTTSVLDRLEADVCNSVTGSTDGQRSLEELDRLGFFLVPLDDRRGSYRYHRLFAQILRHRFSTDDPERCQAAKLRAAQWYLDAGRLHHGITLLVRAGAWEAIVQAVMAHQFELVGAGHESAAVTWLTAVPSEVLDREPRAALILAMLHRLNGDVTEAEAVIVGLGQDAHDGRLDRALHERLSAGWKASGLPWGMPPAEALEGAVATETLLTSDEERLRRSGNLPKFRQYRTQLVGNRTAAAEALLHLGRVEEASFWSESAVEAASLDPVLLRTALGTHAYIDARCGNLIAAAAGAEQCRNLGGTASFHAVSIEPELALAEVAYATDDLDGAEALLVGVEERARSMQAFTRVAQVSLVRAAIAIGRGKFRDGITMLAEHRRERWPELPAGLDVRFRLLDAAMRIFLGDTAGGRQRLRSAGLTLDVAPGAFLTLAAVERDRAVLRVIVDSWPEAGNLRAKAQYLVARALLDDVAGNRVECRRHIEALASLVVPERFVRPIIDIAPSVAPMIDTVASIDASPDLLVLRDLVTAATRADTRRPVVGLSPREATVLDLLATDLTNAEIAESLGVSPNTLKTHLRRTYLKLGVSTRRDAVRRAVALGRLPGFTQA